MLGIIATIIAAKKGHTTFAWVVGIWSAIEIILLFAKSPYAIGPGGIFVLIAISMSNLNKPKKERKPTNDPPKGNNKLFATSSYETTNTADNSHLEQETRDTTQIEENTRIAPLLCDVPGYIECPLCHTRQKVGRHGALAAMSRLRLNRLLRLRVPKLRILQKMNQQLQRKKGKVTIVSPKLDFAGNVVSSCWTIVIFAVIAGQRM